MHLVYLPVVNAKDKVGNNIRKISASEFWKGKDSYKKLQNQFYKYITEKGFDLERGKEDTNREHISTDDMKKLTNFYNTKKLKEKLSEEKNQTMTYQEIQDFYKYENFTKENVEQKLIQPIVQYKKTLINKNHTLLLELSRAKNAQDYYKRLQLENEKIMTQNKELEDKLKMNEIELNACYNVIKEIIAKNEKMERILREKFGIEINDEKNKISK